MAFDLSDIEFVAAVLLLAWLVITYIDGGGGGRRARVTVFE